MNRIPIWSFTVSVCLLTILLSSSSVFAWGAGHEDLAAAIFERLPGDLRSEFTPQVVRQAISRDSQYPDSIEPFAVGQIGLEAMDRFKAHGIKNRHDLHSDVGRAVAFSLLVDALRVKQFERAALWIAALSHSTADMVACNHDPLIHAATYGWNDWGLKLPGGVPIKQLTPLLDLRATAADRSGGQLAFTRAIGAMTLRDDQRDAATALVEIMLYGQEGARYCAPRGAAIMAGATGWIERQDGAAREQLWKNVAELGAWAVVRTVRDVEVALRLARDNQSVQLTAAIHAAFGQRMLALVRDRRLEEDSLFAPLWRNKPTQGQAAVGVVMEPTWRMDESMLGFASRLMSASIARTLQQAARPHVALDIRTMIAEGFPSPSEVPVVIVTASSLSDYQGMKIAALDDRITDYLARGGRVMWIGGTTQPPAKSLKIVTQAMKRGDTHLLPVSRKVFLQCRVRLAIGNGDSSWKVAHSPQISGGWQLPMCPWQFNTNPSPDLEPALIIESTDLSRVVGVIAKDRTLVYLPIYAMTPYLLEGSDRVTAPAEPALDAAGRTILFAMLERLQK